MPRLFAWSDLHVDYADNFRLVAELSDADYSDDTILIAGDLSSNAQKLIKCLEHLNRKFSTVSFVPGNHDLWVSSRTAQNSLQKLHELQAICRGIGVQIEPFEIEMKGRSVCVVPLLSWYLKPEEDAGSLFLAKPGEDPALRIWSDNYRINWPQRELNQPPALHLLDLNTHTKGFGSAQPIISFSHFLPRVELVFSDWGRYSAGHHVIMNDPNPEFNFTRVAGCKQLDELLRSIGSRVHIYGHQHRNRDRTIDGVRYISHCLGYPQEWLKGDTHPPRHFPFEIVPNLE